ncbi:uncharacterized protein ASCRUDRAFT_74704 [Ascoidea rubescens DSM 1968]|uniref:Uncharacterized protein n=1 Tax=Ascoidea rubescens DSM 1968 TaxID=1344418 RepID=A0A1D2VL06_9ASCO|nr:hypothetical protein ASCRUDRAFT_74704 [Ascoidea rubescens DSM 1968]ODV62284.1 hypothetical protein ASCRUDRAFT_74704 [Ascoidea rubescens DSM 1968]
MTISEEQPKQNKSQLPKVFPPQTEKPQCSEFDQNTVIMPNFPFINFKKSEKKQKVYEGAIPFANQEDKETKHLNEIYNLFEEQSREEREYMRKFPCKHRF